MRSVAGGLLAVAMLAPAAAGAAKPPELRCQEAIANSARTFTKKVHRVRAQCENLIINGQTCDGAKDAARIGKASAKLEVAIRARCTDADLAAIGFPGQCVDGDGPPFTPTDAAACVHDTHLQRIETLVDVEYPEPPGPVERRTAHCGEHIGRSSKLVDRHAKARQRCLNLQNLGKLSGTIDCLENSDPSATGDAKTDQGLAKANSKSAGNIDDGCANKTLEDLGFPGDCDDPDGSPFTLEELIECVRSTHSAAAIEMIEIQYALVP